jgi:hypothetical protein
MDIAHRCETVRGGSGKIEASHAPTASPPLTVREAINGAVLAAMIASYFVIVFLASS